MDILVWASFNVPSNATLGIHPVYALDGHEQASTSFKVTNGTTSALIIQTVFTRNGNGKAQNTFATGDAIQYVVYVNNSSGNSITTTFHYQAYGPNNTYIFDKTFSNVSVPQGLSGWYTQGTVPKNAPLGTYTMRVHVADQNNAQNQDTKDGGQFTVTAPAPCPNTGHCYVVVTVTAPPKSIGASAYIQVYKPTVASGDLESLAQLTVFNKTQSGTITFDIEVGWVVAPGSYTDSNTHLFVFVRNTTKIHVKDRACLVQPALIGWKCGFVAVSGATDYPGEILSLPGGTVKTFYVVNINGNWWIQYDANWIGYIQGSWFNGQFKNVAFASWQGEIATKSSNPTTQMGNGTCGTKSGSAHFYTMQVETATTAVDAGKLPVIDKQLATDPNFYNGKFSRTTSGTGSTLAYGGPTGCP